MYLICSFLLELFCMCCFAYLILIERVLWKCKENRTDTVLALVCLSCGVFLYILFWTIDKKLDVTISRCRTTQTLVRDSASRCFDVWVSCVQTELWVSAVTDAQCGLVQRQALTCEQCWECCGCLVLWEDLTYGILWILRFWFVLYGRASGRQHMVIRGSCLVEWFSRKPHEGSIRNCKMSRLSNWAPKWTSAP